MAKKTDEIADFDHVPVDEDTVKSVSKLTDEESAKLIRYKSLGNLSQQDAQDYHNLLNKEAGK